MGSPPFGAKISLAFLLHSQKQIQTLHSFLVNSFFTLYSLNLCLLIYNGQTYAIFCSTTNLTTPTLKHYYFFLFLYFLFLTLTQQQKIEEKKKEKIIHFLSFGFFFLQFLAETVWLLCASVAAPKFIITQFRLIDVHSRDIEI